MLNHDFKLALRSLRRDKVSTGINFFGLSAALASIIFIGLFVRQELGTDAMHQVPGRLFRVVSEIERSGQTTRTSTVAPPVGPALAKEFPEINKATRLRYADECLLRCGEQLFYEQGLWYADSTFFEIFNFPLALGDPATALDEPNTVVLTPEIAWKYFGSENPLGQSILLDGSTQLRVSGVLANAPQQTHLNFNLLVSFSTFRVPPGYPVDMGSWDWSGFHTYVLLSPRAQAAAVEANLPKFLASKMDAERVRGRKLLLQDIRDCYFHSAGMFGANRNHSGNLTTVWALGGVATLILLVAAFNFTNMTLARSVRRAQEVGVRKVLGADSRGLLRLFLMESLVLTMAAMLAGSAVFYLFKTPVEAALGWQLSLDAKGLSFLGLLFFGLTLLTALLAGWLPAHFFSRNKVTLVLKGAIKTGKTGDSLRGLLVGGQFAVMTALLAGAFVVREQLEFMQKRNLGYDRESVISLQLFDPNFLKLYEPLRARLLENPMVENVSAGEIFEGNNGSQPIRQPNDETQEAIQMDILGAYFDYFKTLGVGMAEGREFQSDFQNDTLSSVVLNESAVRRLGWADPIGREISVGRIKPRARVVGVVRDFHYRSLHEPIKPLAIFVPETEMRYVLVRVRPGNLGETIASLRQIWEAALPEKPFDAAFLDENLQMRYLADHSFSKMILFFGGLTVLIAVLGLYGLTAILFGFRVKEIGIRKVLGASVAGIMGLLAKDFLKLVVVAIVIASPIAYYFMQKWLADFAYRIDIQWWMFAMAGLVAVGIAVLTVGFQSVRAALANPVKSLRSE